MPTASLTSPLVARSARRFSSSSTKPIACISSNSSAYAGAAVGAAVEVVAVVAGVAGAGAAACGTTALPKATRTNIESQVDETLGAHEKDTPRQNKKMRRSREREGEGGQTTTKVGDVGVVPCTGMGRTVRAVDLHSSRPMMCIMITII